jgi:hypothetical protein
VEESGSSISLRLCLKQVEPFGKDVSVIKRLYKSVDILKNDVLTGLFAGRLQFAVVNSKHTNSSTYNVYKASNASVAVLWGKDIAHSVM